MRSKSLVLIGRRRLVYLVTFLLSFGALVSGVTISKMYHTALEQQRARLTEIVQSQTQLIKAVAGHELKVHDRLHKNGTQDTSYDCCDSLVAETSLSQILEALRTFEGIGNTGEFALARREDDWIVFLLRHRYFDLDEPQLVPFDSKLAEPIRQALSGKSGTIVGLDYRGEEVLAAFAPVAMLNLGIVAKIDMAEIRAPYIQASLATLFIGIALVLQVIFLFFRVGNPIIRKLEEYERKYRVIFDQAAEGILLTDAETGKIFEFNNKVHENLGYTREEFEKLSITDFETMESGAEIMEHFREIIRNGNDTFESTFRKKNGDLLDFLVNCQAITIGEKEYICALWTDITERKQAEADLARAEKLESVGVLAGGIAHDFNNLLTGIMANIEFAQSESDDRDRAVALNLAIKASERAKRLSNQLLTFAKGGDPIRQVASVVEIIRESATFALTGSGTDVEFYFDESLHLVNVDKGQIGQVIHNLVTNASSAMNGSGTVQIFASDTQAVSDESSGPAQVEFVRVDIKDKGTGIPAENLKRVFDPYYTTKQGVGHGLGLAAVHSIIKKHGANIALNSRVGAGTTFSIYLPACSGDATSEPQESPPPALFHKDSAQVRSMKILVMDDEEFIRDIANRTLTQKGHSVACAANGWETIELYRQAQDNEEPFDVVVLDLTVPGGMGGKETLGELLEIDPDVTAIVCSGYATDPVMSNPEQHGFKGIVAKPFKPSDLLAAVHRVGAGKPTSVG